MTRPAPRPVRRPGARAAAACAAAGLALVAILALAGCGRDEAPPPPEADPGSLRSPAAGPVVGRVGAYGSHEWLGLPFAEPPVGRLRWRAPRPAARWTETREALRFASPCPQVASPLGGVVDQEPGSFAGDEDCLHLNVYAPRFAAGAVPTGDARLPVLVWIHGGGNVIGHASYYDGGRLAAEGGAVVVTINYRLGPLGWLRHASLRDQETSAEDRSGNFGTLDQIRALGWVRENIGAFGGDPGRVTVFGESAGGRNVMALLLAPKARGLFHRAISQSGSLALVSPSEAEEWSEDPGPGRRRSSQEALARVLGQQGQAAEPAEARARLEAMSSDEIEATWRNLDPETLIRAYQLDRDEGLIAVPNVFADGVVLPEGDPMELLARPGATPAVPVMLGTNRDENRTFLFASPRWVRRWFGLIPRLRDETLYVAAADALSAMWKVRGADAPADALVRGGNRRVFVYRWDWDEEPTLLGADLAVMLGAGHGLEIPFVFGHWNLGKEGNVIFSEDNEPGRVLLGERMRSYWVHFAATGDPGRGRDGALPAWQPWRPEEPRFLVFDTEEDGGLRMEAGRTTAASILARVGADPALSPRQRCQVYREIALSRSPAFGPADYAALDGACAEVPLVEGSTGP